MGSNVIVAYRGAFDRGKAWEDLAARGRFVSLWMMFSYGLVTLEGGWLVSGFLPLLSSHTVLLHPFFSPVYSFIRKHPSFSPCSLFSSLSNSI